VIGLYQEPGWETVTALFFARDDRFAIFAIAPESRATRKLRCRKSANVRLGPKNRPHVRLTFHQSPDK
jgi:hypothetical protein